MASCMWGLEGGRGCVQRTLLWLTACDGLANGCALSTLFMGISNCRQTPYATQSPRSTTNWPMARRSAVGAATQNLHELNHGETGKSDPLWSLNPRWPVVVIHGGFGGRFMEVWVRFMEVWIHGCVSVWGARNSAPPLDRHTHTQGWDLENPKD